MAARPDQACLRWQQRRSSLRFLREHERLQPGRYRVGPLAEAAAKAFVCAHHYSGSLPATRLRYGLWDREDEQLVGACVLSVPVQERVLTKVFPGLEPYRQSLELGRFVLLDRVPANAESFFLARAFAQAAADGIRGVVSFSDPLPRRRSDGSVLMPGHVGTIYQAANALYVGRGAAGTLLLLPDGTTLNQRSLQKLRAGHRGRAYVLARLLALGAQPPPEGADVDAWLGRELVAIGARQLRHPGNHRYAFRLGRDRRERRQTQVALPAADYPKRRDELPALSPGRARC